MQPKTIEEFWEANGQFASELSELRTLLLSCGLEETFKWAFPTYTHKHKNLISIRAFKEYYALWFFQGVFLADPAKVLSNAQEGKTKAMRHWKFNPDRSIDLDLIRTYVYESIDNQEEGKVLKVKVDTSYQLPELLEKELENETLKSSFFNLSQGKQKEYANYIAAAKQEKTKLSRLEKVIPMILKGKGLNDKYKTS